jgi:hypothetical protein
MHPALSREKFESQVGKFPADLAAERGWIFHSKDYPAIDVEFTAQGRTALRLTFDFSDWDDQPPSITLLSSAGTQLATIPSNPTGIFNQGPHPTMNRPFICTKGSREFHTHPSHLNETWDQCRGTPGFEIGDILHKLWTAWRKGVD